MEKNRSLRIGHHTGWKARFVHDDEWQLWLGFEDETMEPGFIIGLGDSQDDALTDAVASLEDVVEALQGHPSTWTEE